MEAVELFNKGGAVMYLLLISSVAVVAIGIERFRFYSYAAHESENFFILSSVSFIKKTAFRADYNKLQGGGQCGAPNSKVAIEKL